MTEIEHKPRGYVEAYQATAEAAAQTAVSAASLAESSRRLEGLTKWLIALAIALVGETAVLIWLTIELMAE